MRKIGNNTVANATSRLAGNTGNTYRDLLDLTSAPWKPKFLEVQEGQEYRFDVIPYVALSKKDPLVFARKNMVNDIILTLDVPAHRLGPTFSKVLCPSVYGKPCESCELRRQGFETVKAMNIPRSSTGKASPEYTAASEQHVKPWKSSMRSFCWVRPYEKRGSQWLPLNEPMILEYSAAFFSEHLYARYTAQATAGSMDIGDVVNSYSVYVQPVKANFGVTMENLIIVPRTVAVPDEMEEMCFSLSEYLVETSSKEIKELCYGAEPDNTPEPVPVQPVQVQPAYVPPQAQPAQPIQPAYTPSTGPHAYTPQEQPDMTVDFGDVASLGYGDKCPSGHRFARDLGKKPECAACQFVADCTRVAEED